jgi:hypothetical protein
VIRKKTQTTKMNEQQQPPLGTLPWNEQVKFQSLSYDEKVMFLYPQGGRTVICRCFANFEFEPGAEQSDISKTLCTHMYRQHRGGGGAAGRDVATPNAISSISNEFDLPLIPADSTRQIREFAGGIQPLVKVSPLISVP